MIALTLMSASLVARRLGYSRNIWLTTLFIGIAGLCVGLVGAVSAPILITMAYLVAPICLGLVTLIAFGHWPRHVDMREDSHANS